jgi:hypothetical protein
MKVPTKPAAACPQAVVRWWTGKARSLGHGEDVAEAVLPNCCDLKSFVAGMFEGIAYQCSEFRDTRLKEIQTAKPVSHLR